MASASSSGREELELTAEEAERLARAFRDEGFRKLFAEYAAELADPAQRAQYEAEVAALERERGVEARFLHPRPGWVLRTSQEGSRRCYLNLCSNALVGRPQARPEPGGSAWSLPHCLSPGREELSRRSKGRVLVYDVLFHPDTLRLAARQPRFRRLVEATALEAVEKHFAPGLDRANAAPVRGLKYKGVPQASLLRTPLPGGPPPSEKEKEKEQHPLPPFPTPYSYPPPEPEIQTGPPPSSPPPPPPATPRWTLRHRSYVDLLDYRHSRDSAPSPIPRELELSVELPLLRSAAKAQLEVVGERELRLDSPPPAAYRLRLRLPYAVDEARAKAAFDKATRRLVVTLPVLQSQASPPREGEGEDSASGERKPPPPPPPSTNHEAQASTTSHPLVVSFPDPEPVVSEVYPAAGFTQKRSPLEAPTSPAIPALPVGQKEDGSLSLLLPSSSSDGNTLEQPETPARSCIFPEGQPHPSKTDMDHDQSQDIPPPFSDGKTLEQPWKPHPSKTEMDHHHQSHEILAPFSAGNTLEQPGTSTRSSISPESQSDPSKTDMDHHQRQDILPPFSNGKILEQPGTPARSSFSPESQPHPSKTDMDHHQSHSILPSSSTGSTLEQPGTPTRSSISAEGQPHPSNSNMGHHHQSPEADPFSSPPCAHLCSNTISQPSENLLPSGDCPNLSQGTELSTNPCIPLTPLCSQSQTDAVAPALCPQSGTSASAPPLLPSAGLDPPPLPPVLPVGLPNWAEEMDPVVPDMAAAAAAELIQKRSPPETATSTIPDLPVGQEEALSLPLLPSLSAGNTLEQPGTSARSSIPPEDQPHPSKTDRDHHQSHNIAPLLSPPGAHLSSNIISQPSESPMASGDFSSLSQSTELSTNAHSPVPPLCSQSQADAVAPTLCPRSGTSTSAPLLPSPAGPDAPPTPFPCPDSLGSPASPALLLCPPFHCTQDEKVLTLLLQVPGVVPQSLKGEVSTDQYRVSFDNKDSDSYTILLRFLPENKLIPTESEVSVSPHNVIVVLAKSPEATGLWTKLYFGPNVDTLQERWFVTENNVDKFLSSLPSTSCSAQSEMKEQPLIEVLDISEGKSQIRLKAQEPDKTKPRRGNGKQGNGSKLSTDAENCLVQSERVSGSLTAVETMGQVGKGPSYCLALDLHDPSSAIPQESQRLDFHESELASSTSSKATSTTSAQLSLEQPAQTGEEEEICSEATENKQRREGSPAAPVIMETNMQDGTVQYISHHTTHSAVTFQNALLYELD